MTNRRTRAIPEPSADEREEPERQVRRPKTSQAPTLRRRGKRCRGGGAVGHDAGHGRQNGIDGLSRPGVTARFDESRFGVPRRVGDEDVECVVALTLESIPREPTRWSTRSMAATNGISPAAVRHIRRAFGPNLACWLGTWSRILTGRGHCCRSTTEPWPKIVVPATPSHWPDPLNVPGTGRSTDAPTTERPFIATISRSQN